MEQTPNNNQPNQPTPAPSIDASPSTSPTQTPPATSPSVPPTAPQAAAPSPSAPLSTPNQTPPVNQDPASSTPPPIQSQPPKKSAMPLVIGGVVVLLLAIGVASFVLFSKNKAQTAQTPTPIAKTTPVTTHTAPSQNTIKQIQAVDSNASDSSDLQGIQSSIDQL